jgi:CMP-N,N'-diacetyllegionaminic acid synthase
MIDGQRVLAIIPARGGSKGVPRKNIREVGGWPLIAWTIEEARKAKYVDRLILSSEDAEIIRVAKEWGCDVPFVRPAELAQDDTPGIDPVLHAASMLPEYDVIVVLQATSPLRIAADIDGCIEHCMTKNAPACVSVTEADQSPFWMFRIGEHGKMQRLIEDGQAYARRQELPLVYVLNGAVYVARRDWLTSRQTFLGEETLGYVMPPERSLDIDTEVDLQVLQIRLRDAV